LTLYALQGGSWLDFNPYDFRAAYRDCGEPGDWHDGLGFRIILRSQKDPDL